MKIFHTSDWHLGQSFYGHSRTAEQRRFIAWLQAQLLAHRAAAIIIAGDIFDVARPPNDALRLFHEFLSFCAREQICVIATAGNHDSAEFLAASGAIAEALPGVHVVAKSAKIIALSSSVRVAAAPFLAPKTARWLADPAGCAVEYFAQLAAAARDAQMMAGAALEWQTSEDAPAAAAAVAAAGGVAGEPPALEPAPETAAATAGQNPVFSQKPAAEPAPSENPLFSQKLPAPSENPVFSKKPAAEPAPSENPLFSQKPAAEPAPEEPAKPLLIGVGHLATSHCEQDGEHSIGGELVIAPQRLAMFDYFALGHIHRAGGSALRYCGSPLAMSFAEAAARKSISVLAIDEAPLGLLNARKICERATLAELEVPAFCELKTIDLAAACESEIAAGAGDYVLLNSAAPLSAQEAGELKKRLAARGLRVVAICDKSAAQKAAASAAELGSIDDLTPRRVLEFAICAQGEELGSEAARAAVGELERCEAWVRKNGGAGEMEDEWMINDLLTASDFDGENCAQNCAENDENGAQNCAENDKNGGEK